MKSKLTYGTPAVVSLLILVGLLMVTGTAAPAAENKSRANPALNPLAPPTIDPTTGLPLTPPPPWKDPAWQDPDKVLTEVHYDILPLGEVARQLRLEFKDAFDVLIPNGWQDPNNSAVSLDPHATSIKMQLKNVRASEVFNAMNLMFEAENSPYRWELKLNGNRPTAMLRVLPQFLAPFTPPRPQERLVYFVGDLIGDDKSDGMTMEQLVKTVSDVYQMGYGPSIAKLQFHKEAQLLIVTGTGEQIGFVQQTLSALRQKARVQDKPQPKGAEPKAKAEETKTR